MSITNLFNLMADKFVNCGDVNFIQHGGIQVRYNTEVEEFEIYRLMTADHLVFLDSSCICMRDIFSNWDPTLEPWYLVPTEKAIESAKACDTSGYDPEDPIVFIYDVVHGWMFSYGSDHDDMCWNMHAYGIADYDTCEHTRVEAMENAIAEYLRNVGITEGID